MRKSLKLIAEGYFLVGAALSAVLLVSYPIGIVRAGGWSGLPHDIMLFLFAREPLSIFSAFVLRALLWLPSLLVWYVSDNPYSFWEWLAPGLFVQIVS